MVRIAVVTLTLLLALAPLPSPAQDDNAPAVALFPEAELIGEGWTLLATGFPGQRHHAFRAAAVATYGGPSGARVVLDTMLVADSATAPREAWERGVAYLQWYDQNMLLESNPQRDQELAAMAPPPGCADALRIEGRERIGSTAFPIGVTLCAVEPDIIIVAAVSGELNGIAGVAASDAVIATTLAAMAMATPTPE
jgi:hypothetical protein